MKELYEQCEEQFCQDFYDKNNREPTDEEILEYFDKGGYQDWYGTLVDYTCMCYGK